MEGEALTEFFDIAASPENPFSILETLEEASRGILPFTPFDEPVFTLTAGDDVDLSAFYSKLVRPLELTELEDDEDVSRKKVKLVTEEDGQINKVSHGSHVTVERNRRKQMNENLTVLRSLMPCFYVKRGDQASIIGGVVEYIKELQQVLQSLQAKKHRKFYSDVLSPRVPTSSSSSPRPPLPLCPRPANLPKSPTTPQSGSPYKPRNIINIQQVGAALSHESSLSPTTSSLVENTVEMPAAAAVINSKSPVADVEVKFSGPNVILKTVSQRIPGQAVKIIAALEEHSLEIVHVSINTSAVDDAMLNSFTVKIGIECELSAEELAQEIQQTFS